jgi:hypothetical protein
MLSDGSKRGYLEDGDVVRITAMAGAANLGVGFGFFSGVWFFSQSSTRVPLECTSLRTFPPVYEVLFRLVMLCELRRWQEQQT